MERSFVFEQLQIYQIYNPDIIDDDTIHKINADRLFQIMETSCGGASTLKTYKKNYGKSVGKKMKINTTRNW
jgi:hypothetical protein